MAETRLPSAPGTLTRASSGLVRQVGSFDTGLFGLFAIAIGYATFVIVSWPFYGGASMELATAFTIIGGLALGLVFALLSSVYPRSGGEYVFTSRTVTPSIGFAVSFTDAIWQAFYFGVNGAFTAIFGLSPLFLLLGVQMNNSSLTSVGNWFGTDWGIFITAAVIIVLLSYLLHRGMRTYFRVQRWIGIGALGSVLLTIIVLVLGKAGVLHFAQNLNELSGPGSYGKVLALGTAGGGDLSPAFSLRDTLFFMIWPAFSVPFAVLSTSFSGEIKNVRRGQLYGISGAIVVSGLIFIGLMYFGRGAVGSEFLRASTFADPAQYPLPSPFINTLASVTAGPVLMTILIGLWVPLFNAYAAGVAVVYTSRAMFAWSLDGVVPAKLNEVSARHHSPTWAIVATAAIGLISVALFAFTGLVTILSGLIGIGTAFLAVAIIGALFPFINRDAYEGSTAAVEIGGVPVVTIAGVVAAVFMGYVVYRAWIDDHFGANSYGSRWVNAGVIIFSFVLFYAAKWYRRRQGIDINERYREIPVE
jgi:amino acid transporter